MFSNFRLRLAAVLSKACLRVAFWFVPCALRRAALVAGEVPDVPGALPGYSGPALSIFGGGVVPIAGVGFYARAYFFFIGLHCVFLSRWSWIWAHRSFLFWCVFLPCFQR